MNQTNESQQSRSLGKMVLAAVVLVVAAWLVLKLFISLFLALAVPIALILAVVGVVWAVKTLF